MGSAATLLELFFARGAALFQSPQRVGYVPVATSPLFQQTAPIASHNAAATWVQIQNVNMSCQKLVAVTRKLHPETLNLTGELQSKEAWYS